MPRIRNTNGTVPDGPGGVVWNIAAYIRLSREDGGDESLSVTNQRKIIAGYLERYFDSPYQTVEFYVDDGLTATDYDRAEFQRMLRDIEAGRINCIICKTLSRAFRNYADQGYFLETYFPLHGTRFISIANPPVDSFTNPDAIEQGLEVPITGLMNDRYAGKTSADVRQTFATKRMNGEFIGAFAPFGYQKDPEDKNHLIIDPDAAPIVQDIYHWYVYKGMSKRGISQRLNELGLPNPTAYKQKKGLRYQNPRAGQNDGLWCAKTISDILQNRMYLGDMVQGKQKVISYKVHNKKNVSRNQWLIVPAMHQPIIDITLFDSAQRLNLRDARTAPGQKSLSLFSGLLRCGDCKKSMTRRVSKGYAYYACRTYKDKKQCTKHTIREDTLYRAVLSVLQRQIALVDSLPELINEISRLPAPPKKLHWIQQLEQKKRELEKTSAATDDLYLDWKSNIITLDEYQRMKLNFTDRMLQFKSEITTLEKETGASEAFYSENSSDFSGLLKNGTITELNRGLLNELIETIFIQENGSISIEFTFSDPFLNQ